MDNSLPEIEIKTDCMGSTIYINGIPLKGVTKWRLVHEGGHYPKLQVEFFTTHIRCNAPVLPEQPEVFKGYYANLDERVNSGDITEEQANKYRCTAWDKVTERDSWN